MIQGQIELWQRISFRKKQCFNEVIFYSSNAITFDANVITVEK